MELLPLLPRSGRALLAALLLVPALRAQDAAHPQYGPTGYDLTALDPHAKPGDDFFRYACGSWIDRTEIPGDKPAYTLRLAITDQTERRLHELIEAEAAHAGVEPTTVGGKVGAFYRSFLDDATRAKLGATPLAGYVAAIRAATTRDQLGALMGRHPHDFEGSLFGFGLDIDLKDPSRYAVYVGQAGLELPDRDYYLEASFAPKKAAYEKYVATLLGLLDWPDAAARAHEVVGFESQVAAASWTKTEQRNLDAIYNPMTPAELAAFAPGFPWSAFLAEAGLGGRAQVVVAEKSAFPKLAALFAATPVETLQAYLAFTVADHAAPYLSAPFETAWFDLHQRTISGLKEPPARWKSAVHAVSGGDYGAGDRFDRFGNLGWAVGEIFTAKYFPPAAKAKIEEMIRHVTAAYRRRIEQLDWMSPATKAEARHKLDTYTVKVGYPDHSRDHAHLVIRSDDLVGNVRRAARADWDFYVGRLGGPVDKSDWAMTPQTNDAYNGSLRDIVFPAGILQPPVFDAAADPAYNFGGAGAIIGHELTHGFDDEGRKLDAAGQLRDWWAAADAQEFDARAKRLSAQYSAFEPLPGVHVNGDLTLGENIADLGGVTLALEAYHSFLGGRPAPVVDGFTGDQRVLLGWAQAWCGKMREDYLRRIVVGDPHSPRMYRVNGVVRNLDAWYEAFHVQPGDKLYLPPDQRVRIW